MFHYKKKTWSSRHSVFRILIIQIIKTTFTPTRTMFSPSSAGFCSYQNFYFCQQLMWSPAFVCLLVSMISQKIMVGCGWNLGDSNKILECIWIIFWIQNKFSAYKSMLKGRFQWNVGFLGGIFLALVEVCTQLKMILCTVTQWLALFPHSKKILGSKPVLTTAPSSQDEKIYY